MNSKKNIWSDLPASTGIATLVCYAGVFNDVIGVEELAAKLGVSGQDAFYSALNEMRLQGRIVLQDGFVGLPDFEERIAVKNSKIATTKQLIGSRLKILNKIGRNPLIKFVGISGSLAADNPTKDQNNQVDIDVFLVTRNQCVWLYNILRGLRNLFPRRRQEPELCVNYVVDESNLMIPNRNFYTATEIRNLIPISGFDAHRKFLQANNWVNYYYPGTAGTFEAVAVMTANGLLNKIFYFSYTLLASIKWLNVKRLRNMSFRTDSRRHISVNVLGPHYGGYQALVQKKFSRLARTWFPELLNTGLIEKLFPDELSAEIRKGSIDVDKIIVEAGMGYDYSKYA
ncbi:MAG TPA: hypothetical protein VGM64_06485 [Lacunisphaera sp.]|jgi:hypothetical protein